MNSASPSTSLHFTLDDATLLRDRSFIGGEWVEPKSTNLLPHDHPDHSNQPNHPRFDVIDPGSGRVCASVADCSGPDDITAVVAAATTAFTTYRHLSPRHRARLLLAWHALVDANASDLATLLTHETGKTLAEARAEVAYAQSFAWWFAGEAERVRGSVAVAEPPTTTSSSQRRVLVIKQPVGVALALVPWNFPLALALRKAAAALAAGCTVIVKPPPEAPLTCLALAALASRAGFPRGTLNVLTASAGKTAAVAEALCLHGDVAHVSFTGSTRVGRLVAGLCAQNLRRCTLELGGNCPFLVFDDADLDRATEQLVALKWRHAGQACVAANRVYVQDGVHDALVGRLIDRTRADIVVGHGARPGSTMGALTTPAGLDRAEAQMADALELGARLVYGSGIATANDGGGGGGGYFMKPTILTGMTQDMLMTREETFAPLCGIYRFQTEEEATRWANDTSMGLASYVFTKDVERVFRLAENLEAGMIGVNTGNSSAAESPFGGMKQSGYGKESGKDVAIEEYLVAKTVTMTLQEHF